MRQSRRSFLTKTAGSVLSAAGVFAAAGWLSRAARSVTRRSFLRPPGALDETDFLATCIRCGRCIDACPNRAIVGFSDEVGKSLSVQPSAHEHGTPVILPRQQACILCNGAPGNALLCTEACPSGALRFTRKDEVAQKARMGTAYVDEKLCYSYNGASCGACVRACPFEGKALRAGLWEKPILDPNFCVGCGLCERACLRYPQAISVLPREA